MGSASNITDLSQRAEAVVMEAVVRLVSVDALNGRYRVGLPISLCTGSMVDVSVWAEPNGTFMVSDDGAAYFEISSGAFNDRIFQTVARAHSEAAGAMFDGGTMLFMRVKADRLRGAIIAMGHLIQSVVNETISRSVKVKAETLRATLFNSLDAAFSGAAVTHDAQIFGATTAEYKVDALVKTDGGFLVFDLFTKDAISVAAAFTKLSDIYRLEHGPKVIGVTRDPAAVGPKLQLISSVAPVVRADAAVDVFRRLVA